MKKPQLCLDGYRVFSPGILCYAASVKINPVGGKNRTPVDMVPVTIFERSMDIGFTEVADYVVGRAKKFLGEQGAYNDPEFAHHPYESKIARSLAVLPRRFVERIAQNDGNLLGLLCDTIDESTRGVCYTMSISQGLVMKNKLKTMKRSRNPASAPSRFSRLFNVGSDKLGFSCWLWSLDFYLGDATMDNHGFSGTSYVPSLDQVMSVSGDLDWSFFHKGEGLKEAKEGAKELLTSVYTHLGDEDGFARYCWSLPNTADIHVRRKAYEALQRALDWQSALL
ncbi:MAG TPA: hypothetical protein VJB87_03640 [Candidatus Nanoarchaeia archaeon]|nr:hypothetical protein [Candidatus Nanoarchaeia archaeon]